MGKTPYKKLQRVLMAVMLTLMAVLLLILWVEPNVSVSEGRETVGYETVTDVTERVLEVPTAPVGMVREFRFRLEDMAAHDTTLVFEFSHQWAEVYLDGEKVYSLFGSEHLSGVRTTGSNWAMIPLYREDSGKEVRVVLTPVYENYRTQEIEFYIGSKLSICVTQFMRVLPELILSLLNIFTGLLLLGVAICFSLRRTEGAEFYALAFLAISMGLWNFTQTDFVPLILKEKTVLIYYISLVMLMLGEIPLIRSVKVSQGTRVGRVMELWCVICMGVSILQLALQLLGIADLRETLRLTHVILSVSAAVLVANGIYERFGKEKTDEGAERRGGVWLLGVGALLDMLLYYVKGTSSGLLFVLMAILCYVLMDGLQVFVSYTRQKEMLEEKETQLTLSRITTMMSQIRSHFVFNILNAISGMCKYDPEKADETVVRFARYLRNNIDIMENDKPVLFSTELSRLEDYVVLEQIRFGDKIEFYADVQTEHFAIPPLILQPVVENAIKHGLTQKQTGGTVVLRTWEEGEQIRISVEDDGVGFDLTELEKERSVGLKNIRYRLHHLVHGTLEVESRVGVGTKVTITIPKQEAEQYAHHLCG